MAVGPNQKVPSTLRRLALASLRLTGSPHPEETIADLSEEARLRRARGASSLGVCAWTLWELFLVALYALRDRFSGEEGTVMRAEPRVTIPRTPAPLRIGQAFRLATRRFRREPVSALSAALTLALGFGAAAAIYATLQGFQRPLPVPEGDEVVRIDLVRADGDVRDVLARLVAEWRPDGNIDALGAFTTQSIALAGTDAGAVRLSSAAMTLAAYELLGVLPVVGRWPDATEERVLLLAEGLWRGRLAADPDVVGRSLRVNGVPHVVIGVMPDGFAFPFNESVWTVLRDANVAGAQLVGRLADGRSADQAAAVLRQRVRALLASQGADPDARAIVTGFTHDRAESGEQAGLRVLLIIVVALLLVSCANVSNILIVRAASRGGAMALHTALGATPRQVVFQMLAEAVTIAGAGAVVGLGVAWSIVTFIESTLADHWGFFWMRVALEPQAVVFMLGLAAGTAVVAGMLPARRAARADPMGVLKRGALGTAAGRPGWASHVLLGGQITLSFVALAASLVIARGLFEGRKLHPDFPADSIVLSAVTLDGPAYDNRQARRGFRRRLEAILADDQRVSRVALSTGLPGFQAPVGRLQLEGVAPDPSAVPEIAFTHAVSAGFFDLMNLGLLSGRTFDVVPDDDNRTAVVSEAFARRHFGADDPTGRRLRLAGIMDDWHQVIGVVQDPVIHTDDRGRIRERVYLPIEQIDPMTFYVSATVRGEPDAARDILGAAVRQIDPDVPISSSFIPSETGSVRMTELLAFVQRVIRSGGTLAILGGVGGLLVAAIGLYGVLAFDVQRRLREIGVRKAIGAADLRILRDVMGWGLRNVMPGLTVGIVIAWFGVPLLGVFLSDADPRNPGVYAGLVGGYLVVMSLATVLPAWRAARLDPVTVLKEE